MLLIAAGFYIYLRSVVLNAGSEIALRSPRCPQDLGLVEQIKRSVSYDALLVLMAAYSAYFLAKICNHLAEMITAPIPAPVTDTE